MEGPLDHHPSIDEQGKGGNGESESEVELDLSLTPDCETQFVPMPAVGADQQDAKQHDRSSNPDHPPPDALPSSTDQFELLQTNSDLELDVEVESSAVPETETEEDEEAAADGRRGRQEEEEERIEHGVEQLDLSPSIDEVEYVAEVRASEKRSRARKNSSSGDLRERSVSVEKEIEDVQSRAAKTASRLEAIRAALQSSDSGPLSYQGSLGVDSGDTSGSESSSVRRRLYGPETAVPELVISNTSTSAARRRNLEGGGNSDLVPDPAAALYQRSKEVAEKRRIEIEALRKRLEEAEMESCTFKPSIIEGSTGTANRKDAEQFAEASIKWKLDKEKKLEKLRALARKQEEGLLRNPEVSSQSEKIAARLAAAGRRVPVAALAVDHPRIKEEKLEKRRRELQQELSITFRPEINPASVALASALKDQKKQQKVQGANAGSGATRGGPNSKPQSKLPTSESQMTLTTPSVASTRSPLSSTTVDSTDPPPVSSAKLAPAHTDDNPPPASSEGGKKRRSTSSKKSGPTFDTRIKAPAPVPQSAHPPRPADSTPAADSAPSYLQRMAEMEEKRQEKLRKLKLQREAIEMKGLFKPKIDGQSKRLATLQSLPSSAPQHVDDSQVVHAADNQPSSAPEPANLDLSAGPAVELGDAPEVPSRELAPDAQSGALEAEPATNVGPPRVEGNPSHSQLEPSRKEELIQAHRKDHSAKPPTPVSAPQPVPNFVKRLASGNKLSKPPASDSKAQAAPEGKSAPLSQGKKEADLQAFLERQATHMELAQQKKERAKAKALMENRGVCTFHPQLSGALPKGQDRKPRADADQGSPALRNQLARGIGVHGPSNRPPRARSTEREDRFGRNYSRGSSQGSESNGKTPNSTTDKKKRNPRYVDPASTAALPLSLRHPHLSPLGRELSEESYQDQDYPEEEDDNSFNYAHSPTAEGQGVGHGYHEPIQSPSRGTLHAQREQYRRTHSPGLQASERNPPVRSEGTTTAPQKLRAGEGRRPTGLSIDVDRIWQEEDRQNNMEGFSGSRGRNRERGRGPSSTGPEYASHPAGGYQGAAPGFATPELRGAGRRLPYRTQSPQAMREMVDLDEKIASLDVAVARWKAMLPTPRLGGPNAGPS
jgi:hypothetical protein